ncbi:hypothetical protein O6H91_15G084600 [Diphasiastrum complanatum]|uniref:Uncharacterized protein n=1 Tax=Diphasiastrum complanatum TaxID=34168 RepID=A0ACC2BL06_DIPCM|nr:hypothetical protein O6H91_15G084600 [Diphasiastrum complanatum]
MGSSPFSHISGNLPMFLCVRGCPGEHVVGDRLALGHTAGCSGQLGAAAWDRWAPGHVVLGTFECAARDTHLPRTARYTWVPRQVGVETTGGLGIGGRRCPK